MQDSEPVGMLHRGQLQPHVIEDDSHFVRSAYVGNHQHRIPSTTTANVVKPLAVRLVRPIPQRAAEAFYEQIAAMGISGPEAHKAIMHSHEWHRKWTMQEDNTNTNNTNNSQQFSPPDFDMEREQYNPRESDLGAKNPSPQEYCGSPAPFRKRMRLPMVEEHNGHAAITQSTFATTTTTTGPAMTAPIQIGICSPIGSPTNVPAAQPQQQPPPTTQELFRPIAKRVHRPKAAPVYIPPPPAGVPRHIRSRNRSGCLTPTSLSPLTLPSVSTSSLHSKERLNPVNTIEDDCYIPAMISHPGKVPVIDHQVVHARDGILHALAISGGEPGSDQFNDCLETLQYRFQEFDIDTRCATSNASEGMWLTLTKPTYFDNLGENDSGELMYTLGRMSFDMFSPTNLVCSLQGNFNSVERVSDEERMRISASVPKPLQEEFLSGETTLRTYNVVTAFTIEASSLAYPDTPNNDVSRPIRGIMTTYGYTLPDPDVPNRLSVWITGGRIEPNDDPADMETWHKQFTNHPPKHGFGEKAKLLAVKLLMGAQMAETMNEDGSMEYTFTRPIGGHGIAFVDTLYVDESLRIVRGHRGTVFVFSRMPEKQPKSLAGQASS